MPKSWHKQQDTTVSPDDQPGAKKPVKIRLVWDEAPPGQPKHCWLPWPFDDAEAAHAAIEQWRVAPEVDDSPGRVPPPRSPDA